MKILFEGEEFNHSITLQDQMRLTQLLRDKGYNQEVIATEDRLTMLDFLLQRGCELQPQRAESQWDIIVRRGLDVMDVDDIIGVSQVRLANNKLRAERGQGE